MFKNRLGVGLALMIFTSANLVSSEQYTMKDIYEQMCIECHSSNGSGNTDKLTPSMRDMSLEEIKNELIEVEKDNGHIIMNHNREKIIEKGMEYSAVEMSEYMFNRFKEK